MAQTTGQKRWYNNKASFLAGLSKIFAPNYKHWLWVTFSAILCASSLPSNHQLDFAKGLLAWFALVPFFLVLWSSKNLVQVFGKAFFAGLVFNLIAFRFLLGIHPLSWLGLNDTLSLQASWVGLFIAALQQALYWGIFGLFFKLLERGKWIALQTALIWVVWFDKITAKAAWGGIPWSSLYYSQYTNLYLIQISDLMGGPIISFLLIAFNVSLAYWIMLRGSGGTSQQLRNALIMSSQSMFLLFCFLAYGLYSLNFSAVTNFEGEKPKVLLLQKNLEASETRFTGNSSENNLFAYSELFKKFSLSFHPNLLVLPEGSLTEDKFLRLVKGVENTSPVTSVISGSYLQDKDGDSYNTALAFVSQTKQFEKYCLINQKKANQRQLYIKQALVPFGEYTPFEGFFSGILKNFQLDYLVKSSFKASNKPNIFHFTFAKVAPLICFEALFPEVTNSQIKKGGQAIVIVGDASWFHEKRDLVAAQMLAASRFRAIENRRDVLLAVNKGPLAHIDRLGYLQKYSLNDESLSSDLNLYSEQTFFTRTQ